MFQVQGKEIPGQNTSKNKNQSKGEIKFKTHLLLTNCSHRPSLSSALEEASKPAPPLNLSGSDTPSVAQVSLIDMEMTFSAPLRICRCTKARRDILEMLQFYPQATPPEILPYNLLVLLLLLSLPGRENWSIVTRLMI